LEARVWVETHLVVCLAQHHAKRFQAPASDYLCKRQKLIFNPEFNIFDPTGKLFLLAFPNSSQFAEYDGGIYLNSIVDIPNRLEKNTLNMIRFGYRIPSLFCGTMSPFNVAAMTRK
jgi:hypothetical protein